MSIEETNISAGNPLASIETMVAKGDDAITNIVGSLIDKNNEVKAGPVNTMLMLQEIYGEPLSQAGFPRPVADANEEAGTNGPREFFEAPKPDGKGALKMTKCNFFTEFWADTSRGKAQKFQLDQIALFGTPDEAKAQEAFKQMTPEKRANLKKRLTNDRSKGRSIIRDAVAIDYVMSDLLDYEDRVELVFETNDAEELELTQYPFNLVDKKKLRNFRPMSVGDVKRLDVTTAALDAGPNGSLYDALVSQLQRDTGATEGEKATFQKFDDVLKAVQCFNNYLDVGSDDGRDHYTLINNLFGKKGSDELLLAWGEFVANVKATWNPSLDAKFRRIRDKQIAAGELDETPAEVRTGTSG